jgi:hypothetical protein
VRISISGVLTRISSLILRLQRVGRDDVPVTPATDSPFSLSFANIRMTASRILMEGIDVS